VQEIKEQYTEWRARQREVRGGIPTLPTPIRSVHDVSAEERTARFEMVWQIGGLGCMGAAFTDTATDARANEYLSEFVRGKIQERVNDPDLAEKLTPTGFPFGSKRTPVGTGYFEMYNRDNVTLVSLKDEPILEVNADGVRTSEQQIDLDVLVLATGFDAFTGPLFAMDIVGKQGLRLEDKWADGPEAYLGVATAGFPNLFMITGPGSPSVLGNVVGCIEQHVEWISALLSHMRANGLDFIEPERDAELAWVDHVRESADAFLISKGPSWYSGANVPGKPRVFIPYVPGLVVYRKKADEIADAGYKGFTLQARDEVGHSPR
jgi:cyclohexanone monooxygenase